MADELAIVLAGWSAEATQTQRVGARNDDAPSILTSRLFCVTFHVSYTHIDILKLLPDLPSKLVPGRHLKPDKIMDSESVSLREYQTLTFLACNERAYSSAIGVCPEVSPVGVRSCSCSLVAAGVASSLDAGSRALAGRESDQRWPVERRPLGVGTHLESRVTLSLLLLDSRSALVPL